MRKSVGRRVLIALANVDVRVPITVDHEVVKLHTATVAEIDVAVRAPLRMCRGSTFFGVTIANDPGTGSAIFFPAPWLTPPVEFAIARRIVWIVIPVRIPEIRSKLRFSSARFHFCPRVKVPSCRVLLVDNIFPVVMAVVIIISGLVPHVGEH